MVSEIVGRRSWLPLFWFHRPNLPMKNEKDLEISIPNFEQFRQVLIDHKEIIDTGRLAEFYCSKLFDLKLVTPHNASVDAIAPDGSRIEIKYRFYSGKVPPGMKINLQNIDWVYYVELTENLLPKHIHKISSKDLGYTAGNRVSFRQVFIDESFELIFRATT